MSGVPPPLRFLAAVVGGWAAVRTAMLVPFWPPAPVGPPSPPSELPARQTVAMAEASAAPAPIAPLAPRRQTAPAVLLPAPAPKAAPAPLPVPEPKPAGWAVPAAPASLPGQSAAPVPPGHHRVAGRWSASAWAFVRGGDGTALASPGTLGGSQLGGRLSYRLNGNAARPLSLTARLSAPAGHLAGAEAALGLEWQPMRDVPLRLLAERRQALGGEGRSAFALLAHGGVDDRPVAAGLRLDFYAQAGIVGARSLDLFADGSARLSLPIDRTGRVRLGAGAWAAAQPGVARLDAGPHVSLHLPGVSLALDWRLRLAGEAAPGSGPAATLSTDF
jgi:hypothetical protein